jgi:DNA-directed RNA polymerase subunit RPC12/RpoP
MTGTRVEYMASACPVCGQKIGFGAVKAKCEFCGMIFHKDCFQFNASRLSGTTATLLFPNQHDVIVKRARDSRIQNLSAADPRQRATNHDMIMMIPEAEILKDHKEMCCVFCSNKVKAVAPQLAKNLEIAERFDDAVKIFDELGMYEDAGRVRRKAKSNVQEIRHTTVDLNTMLTQVKAGGLVSVYKCPNCGGSIKISGATSVDRLTKCEYCGTVLQTDDVVKFIQDILR